VTSPSAIDGLQRTLAAEHAAVFVFSALGGRASSLTAGPLRAALTAAYDVHLARRDQLRQLIAEAGSDPVAAEPAYRLPASLTTARQIETEALRVERVCVATYAALVAVTAGVPRRWAIRALVATAVAETAFGGSPEPLPGLAT
jgi:hypothetical protein